MLKRVKGKIAIVSILAVSLAFSLFVFLPNFKSAKAQTPTVTGTAPTVGDMVGWAWGATTVAPYGGVGWINFSCKSAPGGCTGPGGNWGTHVDVAHNSSAGELSGYAWSNNLGWLAFGAAADSCFAVGENDSPAQRAKVQDMGNIPGGLKIVGWGKFIAADADPNDGWDGCVSFTHVPRGAGPTLYTTGVDYNTGSVSGYAWGDDVVGWVNFACNGCDVNIIFEVDQPDIDFWADATSVVSGGGTTLRWQSQGQVIACNAYSNTSNYPHWKKVPAVFGSQPAQISVGAGNLPGPSAWPISGITQTTTYSLTCTDRDGIVLPTQFVTITVGRVGCMDPLALNYDPTATVAGPCTYSGPSVTLDAVTNTPPNIVPYDNSGPLDPFTSPAYQVGLYWTINSPAQVVANSCAGTFTDQNGVSHTLPGSWTSGPLPGPTGTAPYSGSTTTNIAGFATLPSVNAGDIFTFVINCAKVGGGTISDSAQVIVGPDTPIGPSATLQLLVSPATLVVGSGSYNTTLSWTSNVPLDSCSGTASFEGSSITVPGWGSSLADPNSSQGVNLTTWAGSASIGDQFVFRMSCLDGTNTIQSNQAIVNMIGPSYEPPVLTLTIPNPNNAPIDLYHEAIDQTAGAMTTLEWQALNVNSCVGSSAVYENTGNLVIDSNAEWDGFKATGTNSDILDITSANMAALHPTRFFIQCNADDPAITTPLRGEVCVSFIGVPFPACSVSASGNIPSYQEI